MKPLHYILIFLTLAFFAVLRLAPTWSPAVIGAAMLWTAYHFYKVKLESAKAQNIALQQEVDQLHQQLDASIFKEQKALKDAGKARDVKHQILATVNHEIRTPMNGMLGMASLLRSSGLSVDQMEYVDTIRYCGQRLLTTVNGILVSDIIDGSRSDEEGVQIDNRDFDLRLCIREALALFTDKIDKASVELAYCIENPAPEQINGDRKKLGQILVNLLSNAVRYTKKGEISVTARLTPGGVQVTPADGSQRPESADLAAVRMPRPIAASLAAGSDVQLANAGTPRSTPPDSGAAGQCLMIQVSDTGCGIEESRLELLLKGIDCDNTTHTGLGLAVCQRLAYLMGGTISVESTLDKGSCITIVLPFTAAEKPKYSPLNPGSGESGKKIFLSTKTAAATRVLSEQFATEFPLKILVAEDNDINQRLALKVLAKLGYEPQLACNGKEVLEMPELESYDLILMDIQMPEMDGLEATRMIRLCLSKQPIIIAMTANAMEGDQDSCLQAGMDDYISKPIEFNNLLSRLEKWGSAVKAKSQQSS